MTNYSNLASIGPSSAGPLLRPSPCGRGEKRGPREAREGEGRRGASRQDWNTRTGWRLANKKGGAGGATPHSAMYDLLRGSRIGRAASAPPCDTEGEQASAEQGQARRLRHGRDRAARGGAGSYKAAEDGYRRIAVGAPPFGDFVARRNPAGAGFGEFIVRRVTVDGGKARDRQPVRGCKEAGGTGDRRGEASGVRHIGEPGR